MNKFLKTFFLMLLSATGILMAANRPLALEGSMGKEHYHFRLDLAYDDDCLVWGKSYYSDEDGNITKTIDVYGTYNKRMLASDLVGYIIVNLTEYNGSEQIGHFSFVVDECDNYKNRKLHRGGKWFLNDTVRQFLRDVDVVVAKPMLNKPNGDDLYRRNIDLRLFNPVNDTLCLKNNSDIMFQCINNLEVPRLLPTLCQMAIDTLVAKNQNYSMETLFRVITPEQWYPHGVTTQIKILSEGPKYITMSVVRRLFYRGALAKTETDYYTYYKTTGEFLSMNKFFVRPDNEDLQKIISDEFMIQAKVINIFGSKEYEMQNPALVDNNVIFYYRKGENGFGKCRIPVQRVLGYLNPLVKTFLDPEILEKPKAKKKK